MDTDFGTKLNSGFWLHSNGLVKKRHANYGALKGVASKPKNSKPKNSTPKEPKLPKTEAWVKVELSALIFDLVCVQLAL